MTEITADSDEFRAFYDALTRAFTAAGRVYMVTSVMAIPTEHVDAAAHWVMAALSAKRAADPVDMVDRMIGEGRTPMEVAVEVTTFLAENAETAANGAIRVAKAAGASKRVTNRAARATKRAAGAATAMSATAGAGDAAPPEALTAVAKAANTAADALLETAAVFHRVVTQFSWVVDEVSVKRPLGLMTLRLVELSTAILPIVHRYRYAEEWCSLLSELDTRRARARHLLSILASVPRLGWALRRPLKESPPA